MLRSKIQISDDEIAYAEGILIGGGGSFDDERGEYKAFIKNLDTVDLQAVPGSGKTTALLAKLLILGRHLPFEDGSGILAISHTNAAVDQIKNRIGQFCPKLFQYPNFVGTIQGFVDEFLAQPYCQSYAHTRLNSIDTDAYQEQLWRSFQPIYWRKDAGEPGRFFWGKHIRQAQAATSNRYEQRQICKRAIEKEVKDLYLDFRDYKIKRASDGKTVLGTPGNEKYDAIRRVIEQIVFGRAVISYWYAYHLGSVYLDKAPFVKQVFQRRFRYVFVDEMQDMDRHQYDLLESVFYDGGKSKSVFQRIGDKNQAIFSDDVKIDEIWEDRDEAYVLSLSGSRRLSREIAQAVEPFGMGGPTIEGRNRRNKDGSPNALPPHVILFDDTSVEQVLPAFCSLVAKYKQEGKIPRSHEHPVRAICWRKGEDGKFGLVNYWKDFDADITRERVEYRSLREHLFAGQHDGGALWDIYRRIMNAFVKILRMEGTTDPASVKGRPFTASGLQRYLREEQPEFYAELRGTLFCWSRDVYKGSGENVYEEVKSYAERLLGLFGKRLNAARAFVEQTGTESPSGQAKKSKKTTVKDNIYRCADAGVQVKVGTVHSAKGQTHTATLYLESEYYGSRESDKLKDQFKPTPLAPSANKTTQQSARMVYVGFSRPTHLLCFAAHKDRIAQTLDMLDAAGWEVKRCLIRRH